MLLPTRTIQELHAAAITSGLDPNILVSALDVHLRSSLPRHASPSAQILSDLHTLNGIRQLADGTLPLARWLDTAAVLAGPRREGETFEKALRELRRSPAPRSTVPDEPVPTGGRPQPQQEPPSEGAVRVFVVAAVQDARFVETLERHLAPQLRRSGELVLWDRRKLQAGELINDRVRAEIAAADVALVFLSADALAEDAARSDIDALAARMRPGNGALRVVPILARPCIWESSPLEGLRPLPGDGRPITSQRNADDVYAEVVRFISAIFKDIRENKRSRSPGGLHSSAPPAGDETASELRLGMPIAEIFKRQGQPDLTYVAPEQDRAIRVALRTMGRGLIVEGPTQIGKSTLVRKALEGHSVREIDCRTPGFQREIQSVLDAWDLDRHLVIDDAHLIPAELLGALARFMRWLADVPRPRGKVTLLGINKTGRRLVSDQRDLAGRCDVIRMERQPDEKIRELIEMGERLANLRFSHKAEMVRTARGSFRLVQELCYLTATHAVPDRPPPPVEVVARRRTVSAGPDEVRDQIRDALTGELDDLLFEFVRADRDKPTPAEATPGACFALLWLLEEGEQMRAPVGHARRQFASLEPAFRWIEGGGLASILASDGGLSELLAYDAGELVAQDPRLDYYLSVLDWEYLAKRAGIAVSVDKGELTFQSAGARSERSPAVPPSAPRGLLKRPDYPWGDPGAVRLRELLAGAYPDVDEAIMVAEQSGLRPAAINRNGSAEKVWKGILDAASAQGALERLFKAVLSDASVRAYWPAITSHLRSLGAESAVEER